MVDRHPNEDDLFLLADGGIGPLKAWILRLHLKRCWCCRRVVDDHRRAMHALVEHRERVRRGTAHLDAEMKARFARRLTQVAGEEPALISRRMWLPVAAALAAAAGIAIVLFWRTPSVSADSLLERAAIAEPTTPSGVAAPVVRQELRLRRGNSTPSTLVVWTDLATRERQEVAATPDWDRYRRILARNRVGGQSRSMAAIHRDWRSGIRRKQESVVHRADSTLLSTEAEGPFPQESIARMDLEVRNQDWHALRQTVYVEAGGGVEQYEVEEIAEAVVARAAVPEGVFAAAKVPEPGRGITPESAPRLPDVAHAPSSAQLTSTEVQVWLALHRLNDCLGQPLEVVRAERSIVVRGRATNPDRGRELATALQKIPYTRLELSDSREPATLPPSAAAPARPASAPPPADWVAPLQLLPLDAAHATDLVNAVVPLSGAALDQVWALRRLAERFTDASLALLDASERASIEAMLRDHQGQLASTLAQLKQTLKPVLPADVAAASDVPPNWTATALADFSAVQSLDRAIASLLAPAAPSDAFPAPILRSIAAFLSAAIRITDDLPRTFQAAASQ
jgi:hypothetical protein